MPHLSGFQHLPGYLSRDRQMTLLAAVRQVIAEAPLYQPEMPRTGKPLSVLMTNCGTLGWLTDKTGGYRYQATHPITGEPWPAIPPMLLDLWNALAPAHPLPEACLVNYYSETARLGSHQDRDERDFTAPVVSISLGDTAIFHVGGLKRTDGKVRMTLASGDVVILGGAARLAHHGIDKVRAGSSDLLAEGGRINLTMRRVNKPSPG